MNATPTLIAAAEPAFLLSVFKPLVTFALVLGWAFVASKLDKDAAYYYLKRHVFCALFIVTGILGLAIILLVPIFWIGLPLAVIIMAGGLAGYVFYRNPLVPADKKFEFNIDFFRTFMAEQETKKAEKQATLRLLAKDEAEIPVPLQSDKAYPAHLAFESLMDWALPRKAERVGLLVSGEAETAKMFSEIDGVRHGSSSMRIEDIPTDTGVALIKYLQKAAGLDVDDQRRKQSGSLKIDAGEHGRHVLDLTTSGSSSARQLLINIDPDARANRPLDFLGLLDTQKQALRKVIEMPGKVVLVTAPPAQGLTTTIYSLVNEHDPYMSSVITLERNVELELEGVKHHAIEPGASAEEYRSRLAALLRMDPQVVLISSLPDRDTAQLIAKSADEIRFYIPMKEAGVNEALAKWIKAVGDRRLAAQSLGCVISQRLLRTLCSTCKTAYKPDPAALKKLNLPPDKAKQLHKASGQVVVKDKPQPCPACYGLGYRGRLAAFEVMPVDSQAAGFIASNEMDKLRAHLRKHQMLMLQEAALSKVVAGDTDIKEVTRVLSPDSSSRKKARR